MADCERSAAFYSGVLGLAEVARHNGENGVVRSIWLRIGDAVLMLEREVRGEGPRDGSGHVLALAVDDLGEMTRRLETAGVPVVNRTQHTLYVSDPDGHRVGLSTYVFSPSERGE